MSYEVWPGPMEGVAQEAFVRTANELRLIERWMTPFCRLSCALPHTGKLRNFLAPFAAGNLPVTVQLMGVDPELTAAAATIFADLGAAGINLNFGCPSNRVTAGNAGGGAWKHPDDILRICAACRKVLPPQVPLSIKCRAGWDDPAAVNTLLPKLAADALADKIFFHYRTVSEHYSSAPLLCREQRFQAAVMAAAPLPVILNGDISTAAEADALVKCCGGAGVMCARTWMRDPWLLRRIAGNDAPDPEQGREDFFAAFLQTAPPPGAKLELARMLWGSNSLRFRELLPHP